VSQRRLFWPVQCHINFTRGSVIQTVWGGRWPEESRFQSPAESSLRRVVVVCGSDLPKSDSGTFLGPLLRPHDTTRLASHLRRRVESGLCQTVQYRHIYMQAVVRRLVLPVLSFVRSLVSLLLLHQSGLCHLIDQRIRFHIFKISDLDQFQDEDLSGYSHSVHVMLCLVGGGGRGTTAACSRGLIWTQPVEFHCLSYSHPQHRTARLHTQDLVGCSAGCWLVIWDVKLVRGWDIRLHCAHTYGERTVALECFNVGTQTVRGVRTTEQR
jgi:hypothetical protein